MGKGTISNFGYFFSCLRNKVFYPILLKLVPIDRIIRDINPIENEVNLSDSFEEKDI